MGRRGPPKKPTALKKLAGNPGKRRLPKREPSPAAAAPECPAWLDEEARAEWGRIVPDLVELGVLARVDRAALAAYCQAWSRWRSAEESIAGGGLTFTSDSGMERKRPEVGIAAESMKLMRQFLIEFGLTPAARARVQTSERKEEDPLDTFLSGQARK